MPRFYTGKRCIFDAPSERTNAGKMAISAVVTRFICQPGSMAVCAGLAANKSSRVARLNGGANGIFNYFRSRASTAIFSQSYCRASNWEFLGILDKTLVRRGRSLNLEKSPTHNERAMSDPERLLRAGALLLKSEEILIHPYASTVDGIGVSIPPV